MFRRVDWPAMMFVLACICVAVGAWFIVYEVVKAITGP